MNERCIPILLIGSFICFLIGGAIFTFPIERAMLIKEHSSLAWPATHRSIDGARPSDGLHGHKLLEGGELKPSPYDL